VKNRERAPRSSQMVPGVGPPVSAWSTPSSGEWTPHVSARFDLRTEPSDEESKSGRILANVAHS
jgi:hypothetical protein